MSDYDDYDDELDEDTMENRYLTFLIAKETYGIAIRHVTEIVSLQQITEVPDMPAYILGVINLRGSVIPVVDVRRRFNMEQKEADERTCVVVVQIGEIGVGLIVDTVAEVLEIPSENVAPAPSIRRGQAGRFVCGLGKVGDCVTILLDVQRLLHDEDLSALAEVAE